MAAPEIWMISAEAAPLAHTGGLGDVLRALPVALARRGLGVRRFLPAYGRIDRAGFAAEELNLAVPLGPARTPVRFLSRREPGGLTTTLVECEELFAREGIYGPPGGDYPDNARRFTLLCRAVAERARRAERRPDVLHAHDWPAALVPLFCRHAIPWEGPRPRTVLTIHNVAYQGCYPGSEMDWISLREGAREEVFRAEGIEDRGGINFLKGGLACADALTTVSPTHAREILTPELGSGLDGLLKRRAAGLRGILNGADYEVWDPSRDPHLPRAYGPDDLEARREAARVLRGELGLPASSRPLVGALGRLVHQKGIDVFVAAAPALLEAGADVAILGAGDPALEEEVRGLPRRHPERAGVFIGYHEPLAHRLVAGCDLLAVPSRYEPCGLVQMHALRYGTVPVVHRTGGLADTVRDEDGSPGRGTGYVFAGLTPESLAGTVRRALERLRSDPVGWRALQRRAMAEEFSWDRAATEYERLYSGLDACA